MTTTPTYNFTQLRALLDRAGISIFEGAQIFKVSKVTLYSWCDGAPPNQALLLANTERLIKVIEKAVAAGSLPIVDIPKEERVTAIVTALRKHLNGG